ncbi:TPA: TraX family protein [Enterobacter roggenkampii]
MRKFRMPDLDITGTWVVAVGVFFHLIARLVRKQPEMAVEMGEGLGIAMMIFGGYPWYMGNILFTFAVTGQAMRWFSLRSRNDMLLALAIVVAWLPLSTDSYGLAGVFMLINSYRLCRATEPVERTGYALLWAVMVLLMNIQDAGQAVAGLAIALLVVGVCSDIGKQVKRFWPAHFFVLFYTIHLAVLGILVG